MKNSFFYLIDMLKILLKLKIRTQYNSIFKILKIKSPTNVYWILLILKTIFSSIIIFAIYSHYYDSNYNSWWFIIISLIIICLNLEYTFDSYKKITKPSNIELYIISALSESEISTLFNLLEYCWFKLSILDKLMPIKILFIVIFGIKSVLWLVFLESIFILTTLVINNLIKSSYDKSISYSIVVKFINYIFTNIFIFFLLYIFSSFLAIGLKIFRSNMANSSSLNQDTLASIEMQLNDLWITPVIEKLDIAINLFNQIKSNINILLTGNGYIILMMLSIVNLIILFIIIKFKYIKYYYKHNNIIPNIYLKYINIHKKINLFFNSNNKLVLKDLNILIKGDNELKTNFFTVTLFSYELIIEVAILISINSFIENIYLYSMLIIFFNNILILNQANNIINSLTRIFKYKYDLPNIDIYKMSQTSLKDLYESKVKLGRLFMLIPTFIFVIFNSYMLVCKLNISTYYIVSQILLLILSIANYYLAPIFSLYMSPYIISFSNNEFEESDSLKDEDKLYSKFYNIPKMILIMPVSYLFFINSVVNIFKYDTWIYINIAYCFLTLALVLIFNRYFRNIVHKGVEKFEF
ncbi:hypothetical protein CBE01nite_25750 [Clostridium beijerinckii]|uniref:CirB protein n=1 Tax=Clostridium beijerinckii TaxID=1520 RepID=Q7WYU1_CLOBE|nr:hypothetical protein [Clostridium beijerinckii]NRZ29505.1 hypothetical protein [Clostridium beijerinckii]NYC00007.1 hypothetical protein [Clostridium beijerinckii]OOM22382.1 hypothetical protein CLBEI_33050 [Clostridium beijerinckii]QUN37924.1 hypothetical protein KEC93_26240 [Clostridium beijerinckii]CAD97581.1 CirB protein [Clostridium beijerinckii]